MAAADAAAISAALLAAKVSARVSIPPAAFFLVAAALASAIFPSLALTPSTVERLGSCESAPAEIHSTGTAASVSGSTWSG